jgi:hypothetical protein
MEPLGIYPWGEIGTSKEERRKILYYRIEAIITLLRDRSSEEIAERILQEIEVGTTGENY